ncbi:hypothetical protein [Methylomicrobium sp. Wu6]|uniref:hypothetical protein n=1 Tax=Methylomicrobium sp. Wu6 TaxID=3107928 RepID=UPI002DD6463D|nr:hypothetical protein [Methylomicrobium sp. Wu6]MEC4748493.1 hypothetical protein [Methylomicrobium sp. Wu6]
MLKRCDAVFSLGVSEEWNCAIPPHSCKTALKAGQQKSVKVYNQLLQMREFAGAFCALLPIKFMIFAEQGTCTHWSMSFC